MSRSPTPSRAALALALVASAGAAQRPSTSSPYPGGLQRGTEAVIEFRGRYLFEPQGLVHEVPGLEVLGVEKADAKRGRSAAFKIRVAPDTPLGMHPLRVRTATGVGPLHLLHVGALEEVVTGADRASGAEATLAELLESAVAVPLERTINGVLDGREQDAYAVTVEAGTRVRFDLQAVRLGGSSRDLAVAIHDPEGRVLVEVDDTILGMKDPMGSFVAANPGRYVLRVFGAVPVQSDRRTYRLHVGTFPRPTAIAPLGGRPGETLDVTFTGDDDLYTATVKLPTKGGVFRYFPETPRGVAPTPLFLQVAGMAEARSQAREPERDDKGKSKPRPPLHAFPGIIDGVLAEDGEVDTYYFEAEKGESIEFRLRARQFRSPLDGELILRYASGRYVAGNDDGRGTGTDPLVTFRAPADGEYRVDVRDIMLRGGPAFAYRLQGSTAGRRGYSSRLNVPTRGGDETLAVPRSGHRGHVLVVNGYGDDPIPALLEGLPAGVTATLGAFRKDTPYVPIVLSATADAPLDYAFARPAAPDGAPQPGFGQQITVVRGRNRSAFLSHRIHHIPVVVTEPAPFAVTMELPAVPLALGSYLAVPVHVERAEGFEGAVRASMLWTPPGLSAGAVTIAAGKDRGTIYLSARGDAEAGAWPMALSATATVRGGPQEVASAMTELVVADRWLQASPGSLRVDQGGRGELTATLEWHRPVTEAVEFYWTNLPKGAVAPKVRVEPNTESVTFAVEIDPKCPTGRHRPILRMKVPTEHGVVIHQDYGAELRVDPPATGKGGPKGGGAKGGGAGDGRAGVGRAGDVRAGAAQGGQRS